MSGSLGHCSRLRDAPAQPWRNGGGSTRELLRWPLDAPAWRLRVSVATVAQSGPFSAFPGVLRWFAVLDGAGVRLDLPDGRRTLLLGDDAIAFDGEAAPACHLVDGPTHDLNLMVVRDDGASRLWRAGAGDLIDGRTEWRALYAAAAVRLTAGDSTGMVEAGSLVWSDATDTSCWRVHDAAPGTAWFLSLTNPNERCISIARP
jgi:uncharacterized protein